MVKLALCEDNYMEVQGISALLRAYTQAHPAAQLHTQHYNRAEPLLAAIGKGRPFDIFLLDIKLPGMDGIALSRKLRAQGQTGVIIFLTGSREFAFEAYGVKALDYLLKPVQKDELFSALERAVSLLDSRSAPQYTMVRMPEAERMVPLDSIVAVEVQGHTLCYYLAGGEVLKSKVLRVSFDQATRDLISQGSFIKPHQSYLVNAMHVLSVSKRKFTMDNGMEIPISRLRLSEVRAEYMRYLSPKASR